MKEGRSKNLLYKFEILEIEVFIYNTLVFLKINKNSSIYNLNKLMNFYLKKNNCFEFEIIVLENLKIKSQKLKIKENLSLENLSKCLWNIEKVILGITIQCKNTKQSKQDDFCLLLQELTESGDFENKKKSEWIF